MSDSGSRAGAANCVDVRSDVVIVSALRLVTWDDVLRQVIRSAVRPVHTPRRSLVRSQYRPLTFMQVSTTIPLVKPIRRLARAWHALAECGGYLPASPVGAATAPTGEARGNRAPGSPWRGAARGSGKRPVKRERDQPSPPLTCSNFWRPTQPPRARSWCPAQSTAPLALDAALSAVLPRTVTTAARPPASPPGSRVPPRNRCRPPGR